MRTVTRKSLMLILSVLAILCLLTGAAFAGKPPGGGNTITINKTVTYQTIDGFGAFGARNVNWSDPATWYNDAWLSLVIDDLGLTITRNEYYPPGTDQDTNFQAQKPFLQAMKQKADASGEPLKFIVTFWSPPGYMKDNGSTKNGGHVLPEYYDDLGTYAVGAIQDYKNAGIDLYGLSLQNEPNFAEPYNSCEYTRDEYRDMIKVAGPIIHASFPNVKLYGAEHMEWSVEWDTTSYEYLLKTDTTALAQMGIWACHGFIKDGKVPIVGSLQWDEWTGAWDMVSGTNRPLWMTETSGYGETWTEALQLGEDIYCALKYGKVSAWAWWQLGEDMGAGRPPGEYDLMNLDTPGKKYYVSKQYYRYVRPGALQIDCASSNAAILAVGFNHPVSNKMTIVLINTGRKSANVTLSGSGLPAQFTVFRSTSSENCINAGTVSSSATISLPATSISTLYSL